MFQFVLQMWFEVLKCVQWNQTLKNEWEWFFCSPKNKEKLRNPSNLMINVEVTIISFSISASRLIGSKMNFKLSEMNVIKNYSILPNIFFQEIGFRYEFEVRSNSGLFFNFSKIISHFSNASYGALDMCTNLSDGTRLNSYIENRNDEEIPISNNTEYGLHNDENTRKFHKT